MLALGAPQRLWLAGENGENSVVTSTYRALGAEDQLALFNGDASQKEGEAVKWLLR
jgi:hypothetical protein